MGISTVIIEDEKNSAESLNMLIEEYCPELSVKCLSYSVADSIDAIKRFRPGIVFLDIEMPVSNGFEILERTKTLDYKTIFTTAHRQYALEAIKHQAVDYLLKPINIDELITAVDKATLQICNTPPKNDTRILNRMIKPVNGPVQNKISIATVDGFIVLDSLEVIRAEADSNYTHLFLAAKKITTAKTLKEIEELLDPAVFMRIHQTHIINLNKVERYIKGDGGYVILSDGTSVPISRSKKSSFLVFFLRNK